MKFEVKNSQFALNMFKIKLWGSLNFERLLFKHKDPSSAKQWKKKERKKGVQALSNLCKNLKKIGAQLNFVG